MNLSIIIPIYNEGENIVKTLQEIKRNITGTFEVIMIYDRENDTSLPPLKKLPQKDKRNLRLVKNYYDKGALNAIKTGFQCAKGKYSLVTMADLSDDLGCVSEMVSLMEKKNYAIVCASRYMKGGKQVGGPLLKRTLSRLAGKSLHFLAGLPTHDPTNSFKLYQTSFIKEQRIESTGGFEVGIELVAKAFSQRKKIDEIPTVWRDREQGKSHFKVLEWLPEYMRWYWIIFKDGILRKLKG